MKRLLIALAAAAAIATATPAAALASDPVQDQVCTATDEYTSVQFEGVVVTIDAPDYFGCMDNSSPYDINTWMWSYDGGGQERSSWGRSSWGRSSWG